MNKEYFENVLPTCIITIQTSPKAYGHFTLYEAWGDKMKRGYHEINIGAESLDRPVANTIATLIHEMVHFYCFENGIKDVSRGCMSPFRFSGQKIGAKTRMNRRDTCKYELMLPPTNSMRRRRHWEIASQEQNADEQRYKKFRYRRRWKIAPVLLLRSG